MSVVSKHMTLVAAALLLHPAPTHCLFLCSTTNQIMVLATFMPLVAGRFGLAPTSTRHTNAGAKLLPADKSVGLVSNDPAGAS